MDERHAKQASIAEPRGWVGVQSRIVLVASQQSLCTTLVGLLLACLCVACDASLTAPPVSSVCSQIGAQCQLPDGPLGVCQQIECAAGAAPPCFTCTSQH